MPAQTPLAHRYAVYAVPGLGDDPQARVLREAAEEWLARPEAADIAVEARRYGYHATLKAPFRLAPGHGPADLAAAVDDIVDIHERVVVPRIALAQIDGFFALVPGGPAPELDELAADLVRGLDDFRAPLTQGEITRRRPERLSARQLDLLMTWGYPYVLSEFRFHITLTDRLSGPAAEHARRELERAFAPVLGRDIIVDAVAVFAEPEPGAPFVVRSAHPLRIHPLDRVRSLQ